MSNTDGSGSDPRGVVHAGEVARSIDRFFQRNLEAVQAFVNAVLKRHGESKVVMACLYETMDQYFAELNDVMGPVEYLAGVDDPSAEGEVNGD